MANPLLGWVAGASPQTLERLQSYRVPVDADSLAILRTLEKDYGRWPEVDADATSLRSIILAELQAAQRAREVAEVMVQGNGESAEKYAGKERGRTAAHARDVAKRILEAFDHE